MIKVAIVGASGYTGVELARILCNHPHVELTAVTSRQYAGMPLAEVFPNLRSKVSLVCENLSPSEICKRADVVFTAVPHKTAMDIVPQLLEAGKKVIDLSADYRIHNVTTYEEWYQPHSSAKYLQEASYGLPELHRNQIITSRLVANPGCYPTSIILGLAPLLTAQAIDPHSIIADSKSGTSGAGRAAAVGTLFCEVNDGFRPYKVGGTHRHIPEIEQELMILAGEELVISFTPHLLPISRGILSTVYAKLNKGFDAEKIAALYASRYEGEEFIRVLPAGTLPATQFVRGSNYCDIGFTLDERTDRVIVTTAIDNVVKGAAGQAVQNMNLICDFPENTGLEGAPFFP